MRIIQFVCFVFLLGLTNPYFGQILRDRPGTSKPAEPKPPKPAKPKPATPAVNLREVLVLKVTSNAPCTFYVDGELKGTLNEEEIKRVNLRKGSYRLKAVSTANKADVWTDDYEVSEDELNQEKFFEIDLQAFINTRENREADVKRAKQLETEQAEANQAFSAELQSNMVRVEGGSFEMGCTSEQSDCQDDEKPVHRVELSTFYMSKYEVTQALWVAVMGSNPSEFSGCAQCPVENVSWDDVQEFLQKLNGKTGKNFRLPTEAEWEYAARGGNKCKGTQYSGGSNMDAVGWYDGNSGSKTHPVGLKQANELGLYDMSGNVWEWCADWYDARYYASSPESNPSGPSSGKYRVFRGGSWFDYPANCRSADRYGNAPARRFNYLGFRLVLPSR